MIRLMIFDLDGTLVQTERLKAQSYARAVIELCPFAVAEDEVIKVFKEVVGLSRREVAVKLLERFDLENAARQRMEEFNVETPWQAFVQVRLVYYEEMLEDPEVLLSHKWSHNLALLEEARKAKCKLGLATMSRCSQVQRVLQVLDLEETFDFIATRDDVEHGKPDPEIYRLVSSQLKVPPEDCLVVEDSPTGVRAALGAGMWCIAVTTPFTKESLHKSHLLDERWIVDDPDDLPHVVHSLLHERAAEDGSGL